MIRLLVLLFVLLSVACVERETIVQNTPESKIDCNVHYPILVDSSGFSMYSSSYFFSEQNRKDCRAEIQSGYLKVNLSYNGKSLRRVLSTQLDTAMLSLMVNIQSISTGSVLQIGLVSGNTIAGICIESLADSLMVSMVGQHEKVRILSAKINSGVQKWMQLSIKSVPGASVAYAALDGVEYSRGVSENVITTGYSSVVIEAKSGNAVFYIDDIELYK
ncbi:MAG: hypothetical protein JNL74_06160 [Fibrobacteres bacterium]|nr:hypothetical protein [Fibrobacterota bacterium]